MMRASRSAWIYWTILCVLMSSPALGQSAASQQQAVAKYKRGRTLIEKKDYEGALQELTASYALMESPNTMLLMAHAQRELGREQQAVELYETVVKDASQRVANGEARYKKTEEDAQEWLDRLSERYGKVSIRLVNASGATVWLGREQVEVSGDSLGPLWWKAGPVQVQVKDSEGRTKRVVVEVRAGTTVTQTIDFGERITEEAPREPVVSLPEKPGKSIPTASWVTAGVGVAGFATFAVFGSSAKSKASELEACSPRCGEAERDVADAGKRDQRIANIGAAVGGVGLLSALGFYLLQSEEPSETVNVSLGPRGMLVQGTFRGW
ncbi:MAG TPA: hypothetical protein PKL73_02060 [Polyangiaceae bacterium]|nr:MAG: hypothetical protein BWY17_01514 [Deltaproteobacteria bacterium ADurb.Bin207]HNS95705.1 hypothetical protein [Polyangiaceae bacterium]HNZ21172.1 hypothetical protein [Polyangiaceae bacterium]HOD23690.1 hypothetical protein [Polyangiaceae bacterium]HOE48082.1 hypothetical protein [Polyangiaceae bacterium]